MGNEEDPFVESTGSTNIGQKEKGSAVSCRGVLLFHVPLRNKRESASSGSSTAKAPFGVHLKRMQALESSSLAPAL